MRGVVRETRRVLNPTGSAVFILQPNSKHVGEMRPWLWEFAAEQAREWNLIQDVYWWNPTSPPNVHCQARYGLMRPSVKYCIWLGPADCYRDQTQIRWSPSQAMKMATKTDDWELRAGPSGYTTRNARIHQTVQARGQVTPFNLLPLSNSYSRDSAGAYGHGAGTPLKLCEWWTRYIVPTGGVALDPFAGVASTGIAALRQGKRWIGIESMQKYSEIAEARLAAETEVDAA
jgi:DNA modification methylase